eukprot:1139865-Pelagomonas_calceolata.AAC.8
MRTPAACGGGSAQATLPTKEEKWPEGAEYACSIEKDHMFSKAPVAAHPRTECGSNIESEGSKKLRQEVILNRSGSASKLQQHSHKILEAPRKSEAWTTKIRVFPFTAFVATYGHMEVPCHYHHHHCHQGASAQTTSPVASIPGKSCAHAPCGQTWP